MHIGGVSMKPVAKCTVSGMQSGKGAVFRATSTKRGAEGDSMYRWDFSVCFGLLFLRRSPM